MAVRDLAWTTARPRLAVEGHSPGSTPPDPSTGGGDQVYRRAASLALLEAYHDLRAAVAADIEMATADAIGAGASFEDIAFVQGVSRQAVRQQWRRFMAPTAVTLSGGPRNGERARAVGVSDLSWHEGEYWDAEEQRRVAVASRYRRKYGSPKVYEFVGFRDDLGRPSGRPTGRSQTQSAATPAHASSRSTGATKTPIRVYELGRELGKTSREVLHALKKMDAPVKSASSRVEPAIANAVRALYEQKGGGPGR